MLNIIVGNDGSNTLQGTAGADVIYGYDPNGPQSQASAIVATRVATSFTQPLFVGAPAGDTSRLFVVEKTGAIKIIDLASGQACDAVSRRVQPDLDRRRQVAVWTMQDVSVIGGGLSNGTIGTDWSVAASGDFNGDGRADVLWTDSAGEARLMNGQNVQQAAVSGTIGMNWRVGGISDINMDGGADIMWVNTTNNAVIIWYMDGTQLAGSTVVSSGGQIGLDWTLSGVGDVTGDQIADIIWTRPNGQSAVWDLKALGDVMTGGAGQDIFPISAPNEIFKVVTDFQAGAGGDVVDLRNLLTSIGHGPTNALTDGTIRMVQNGAATEVQVDLHPR